MGAVLQVAVVMESLTCGECGMDFAVPQAWLQKRVAGEGGNRSFYCPNGHRRHFVGKTEEEKLREELARKDAALQREREQREVAERSARAQQAQATRARNENKRIRERVGRGVCPCCNRTFQQLARHMMTKHPEYHAEADGLHAVT